MFRNSIFFLLYFLEKLILEGFFVEFFFNTLNSIFLVIYSCYNCTISNKVYCIDYNSKKYIEYIQSNCNCNLTIFSTLIKQIYKKQMRLKKEIYKTRTKLS